MLTWGGEHTTQYSDDALYHCALETYITLLTYVTTINSIKFFETSKKTLQNEKKIKVLLHEGKSDNSG